jgi:hypothetical protein
MRYVDASIIGGTRKIITGFRRISVRALILAGFVATGFASLALAAGDNNGTILVKPAAPVVATPPPAPAPAPVVVAPPPPPPAPQVVEVPWPDNVPSIKPGTGGVPLVAADATRAAATISIAAATSAGQSTASATAPAASSQTASLPPTPIPSGPPTTVGLQASVMQGAKPLKDPLIWTVTVPAPGTVDRPGTQVATQNGPSAEFNLPQGTYVVSVKDQEAIVNTVLIVGATPINKIIPLNISLVQVRMIPYTGGKVITDPIHWEVFNSALGPPSDATKIGDAFAPQKGFMLASGYYVVRAHYSDIHADLAMLVDPGVTYSYTVDLYAAKVTAKVFDAAGKMPKGDVSWEVVRTAADATGQHQVVATNTGPNPNFLLREGTYMVIATGADGSVGKTPIAVKAGQTTRITVKLGKPGASG